jgi:WD40 repeat protein
MSVLLGALLLVAPPADPTKGETDLATLIRKLGADSYAEREAASSALAKIGPPALAALRKAMTSGDLEVCRRAERLAQAIEKELFCQVRSFPGHRAGVNGVAFSPDLKRAASGDHRAVRVWDLSSGKETARTDEHDDRVMAVCFSPDGRKVASASEDRTVRLWDAATLSEERRFRGHTWDVRAVAFSHDGRHLVSAGRDRTIRLWDAATGKALRVLSATAALSSLALSPDGRKVLAGSFESNDVLRRDLGGATEAPLAGHEKAVLGVRWSRDGKRALTASQDGTLRLWDMAARKAVHVFKGHTAAVSCVAMSADGTRAVSGGPDGKLHIWDLENGTLVRALEGHRDAIWSVAITPDGRRALSGGNDGTMRLWRVGY